MTRFPTLPVRLALTAAAALAVAGCFGDSNSSSGGSSSVPSAGSSGAPRAVAEALRCWGLTHGSYNLHVAAPAYADGFPRAELTDYVAWHNEALRRAHAANLTLTQFNEYQGEFQMSTRLIREEVRDEALGPLRTCLANVPRDDTPPPELRGG